MFIKSAREYVNRIHLRVEAHMLLYNVFDVNM